jgi:hypothetical protein
MREFRYTVTFRCGHEEVNTAKREGGSIRARLKIWRLSKNQTSIFLCTQCAANNPRHAPPARGVSQTIQAAALGSQRHSVRALQAAQIRWAEVATLSKSEQVEEFLPDHQDLATEAQRALARIDNFWRSAHAEHITGIPSDILSSSERGPDVCPLCREYLDSAVEDLRQASEGDDHSPEDHEVFNGRGVEEVVSGDGLDVQRDGTRPQAPNSHNRARDNPDRPPRKSRKHSRRSRYKPSKMVQTKLSTIMEEWSSSSSSELSDSSDSQSSRPGLWKHVHKTSGEGSIRRDFPSGLQGLWQISQAGPSTSSMHPFTIESGSTRPPLRKLDESLNLAKFSASDNSLWQPPKPAPPPKINPDSVEGTAAIQRIRNYLKFPDATPVELLSIRELPEFFTDIDGLLEYRHDMHALAWKQEDKKAAKIIRATKPDPDSFDGKHTLQRIKRFLKLPETTSIADILAVSELPNTLTQEDIGTLLKDLYSVSWEDKYKAQVKTLRKMVTEAARVAVDPAKLPPQPSAPLGHAYVEDADDEDEV